MISSQPAIPLLVHEDCMGDLKTDLAGQQEILSKIKDNTRETNLNIDNLEAGILSRIRDTDVNIDINTSNIDMNTSSIKTSSSNTATATSSLYSSVGTTEDASTSNTVIGLLKSIANKL